MEHNVSKPSVSNKDDGDKDEDSLVSEEVEPKLKYERLSNDMQSMLKKDSVNCVAFHPKIICIGTRWGLIYLFDHQGNRIRYNHLPAHTVAVNQISMDSNGDFIATCSDDGKVYVCGLYTGDSSQELSIGRSIKSVAIDPKYYKLGVNRRFVTGDDRLVLHEKTFLSRIKSSVLYEAVGRVLNIQWCGQFIAWSCDVGIRVYDIAAKCSLVLIKWTRSENNIIPENYPCCLCWKDSTTLLIGWVDTVRICNIEKRNSVLKETPEFRVTLTSTFKIDYFICGIGPLEVNQLVILGYAKEKDESGKALRPQMYVLQQTDSSQYVEVYTDNLSLREYQDYICNDYQMECCVQENRFIIVCPKDIIIASAHDSDDRIEWLVAHNKFEDAMEVVSTKSRYLVRNSLLSVGKKYLDHLLLNKEYCKAGDLCSKILGPNKEAWEEEVFKFARVHQLRTVSKYLPCSLENKLNPHIYEMVLYEYLKMEPEGFLNVIKEWIPELYNIHAVINAVLEHIVNESNFRPILLESLALLYTHSKQYDKALAMYLKLRHKDVFQLINKNNLFGYIHEMIEQMMDLDPTQAISMLLEKNRIAPDVVVSKLQKNPYYLYLYLDAVEKRDSRYLSSKKYHGLLVKLYANFAPQKLLSLLKRSDSYPIQDALNICQERSLYPEMVYLLGRIGNTKEALQLVINQIGDMEQAISFCKEHDDPELWEELISHSLSKPEFVTYLLQKIGTYVDPRILVQRIEDQMEIPGLKHSLIKMMKDYHLQVSVKEGCKKIVVSDCFDLHKRLVMSQQKGMSVDDEQYCCVCRQKILMKISEQKNNILVYNCHHSFHEECLPTSNDKCIICYSQESGSESYFF